MTSSATPAGPRVALVHEWLDSMAGSEKVFLAMAKLRPDADLYALSVSAPMKREIAARGLAVHTTFLDKEALRGRRALSLPAMPLAWRRLEGPHDPYDVVLTSHHAFAQSSTLGRRAGVHLVYVHTPARYLWSPHLDARGSGGAAALIRPALQRVDHASAQRVTDFAANSTAVRDRIRRYYQRDAQVIHPPVDLEYFEPADDDNGLDIKDGYLLSAGRFIAYKRHDLAIRLAAETGQPIVLAGHGPQEADLRRLAAALGVRARFCIRPDDRQLRALFRGASALVFLGLEDFGIVPVEAQACGTPVIGLDEGGTRDTVRHGVSGFLMSADASMSQLAAAARDCERLDPADVVASSQRFSAELFNTKIRVWMAEHGAPLC
jgi:glycosyltransferase involved in cell wall biosynthesis